MVKHAQQKMYHWPIFLYKIMLYTSPSYLYYWMTYHSDVHSISVRQRGLFSMPVHRSALYNRRVSYNIKINMCNTLKRSLKRCLFLHIFKRQIRKYRMELRSVMWTSFCVSVAWWLNEINVLTKLFVKFDWINKLNSDNSYLPLNTAKNCLSCPSISIHLPLNQGLRQEQRTHDVCVIKLH